jgi:Cu-Zn family superoxide dismutase
LTAADLTTITGLVARPEPPEVHVALALTNTKGAGPSVIRARNVGVTIGVLQETALMLELDLKGLSPGSHAFHVHANPNCGSGLENGELVPELAAGPPVPQRDRARTGITYLSHLGNLPQLVVAADGRAQQ